MNQSAPLRFAENVKRLALGLEPIDSGRGGRIPHPVQVIPPGKLMGLPTPQVDSHDSCLHALLYQPGVAGTINYRSRVRRPVLFPGAAYDAVSLSTGLRGRVTRAGGSVVRWSRVEARRNGGDTIIARAHGDDRGEFLLLLPPEASQGPDLVDPVSIRIDVFGPAAAPVPPSPGLPELDPFWDLPTEIAASLDPNNPSADLTSAGTTLPPGYSATVSRVAAIPLGTVLSVTEPFQIS
jgi:hypothetical protein